jgi:hypothetical protein
MKKCTDKAPILAVESIYYALLALDLLSNLVAQRSFRIGKPLAKILDSSSIRFSLLASFLTKLQLSRESFGALFGLLQCN